MGNNRGPGWEKSWEASDARFLKTLHCEARAGVGDRGLPGCEAATRQALEVRARGLRKAGGGLHPPPNPRG